MSGLCLPSASAVTQKRGVFRPERCWPDKQAEGISVTSRTCRLLHLPALALARTRVSEAHATTASLACSSSLQHAGLSFRDAIHNNKQ